MKRLGSGAAAAAVSPGRPGTYESYDQALLFQPLNYYLKAVRNYDELQSAHRACEHSSTFNRILLESLGRAEKVFVPHGHAAAAAV